MKVALLFLRSDKIQSTASLPLGICYLGAVLEKEGFEVKLFDNLYESDNELLRNICSFAPQIIGFSFLSSEYGIAKYWVLLLRKFLPKSIFVGGGIHISSSLGEFSLEHLQLDYGICGEGEQLFVEFCKRIFLNEDVSGLDGIIWRNAKGVVRNRPYLNFYPLDKLPFPAWHLLDMKKYLMPPGRIKSYFCNGTITLMTSRGCPGKCVYCDANVLFGNRIRTRSVTNVMEEIESVSHKYNFEGVLFFDDTFTLRREWVYEFCKEIKKTKFVWGCNSRCDFIDADILREMKEAGCVQISFGVESGSPEVLKFMKKPIPLAKTISAFELCKKIGIRTYANFLVGFPNEDITDIKKSMQLLKRIKPDFCTTCIVTPFPGTELYRYAVENGIINEQECENFEFNVFSKSNIHVSRFFSSDELLYFKNKLQNINFYRNYITIFFKKRNLKYIFLALFPTISNPYQFLIALKKYLRQRNFDIIVLHCYKKLHEFLLKTKNNR